jgi:hypothetical protein
MFDVLTTSLELFADTSGAITAMQDYVAPTIHVLAALASIACVFFIINAGYLYITSSGKPEQMDRAKHILKNAVLGLVIVLAAATLVMILSNAYGSPHDVSSATLPNLQAVKQNDAGNGLIDILIKAVTGFLNSIIQAVAAPFLGALDYFTKSTPLMADNQSVFNFWLAMVGISDVLLVVIVALLGFHVMSASTFGFDEIEFKHLLPRIGLVFLLMNTSIFFIDGIIELSNVLIAAVIKVSGASSVWYTLTEVVKQSGGQGLAALLIMMVFIIFSVILLVYYVGRLVTLFIGAVLSPLIALIWLVPGFRDFAETALKTYITTIFVLFVHVVILLLASSLFVGMAPSSQNNVPDTLMSMVVGLATVMALLKTQGIMMQFSYVSMGSRNMRKLGGQFINGVSYMTGKGRAAASAIRSKTDSAQKARALSSVESRAVRTGKTQSISYANKKGTAEITHTATPNPKGTPKTGTTYEAPKVKVTRMPASNLPKNNSKDKTL